MVTYRQPGAMKSVSGKPASLAKKLTFRRSILSIKVFFLHSQSRFQSLPIKWRSAGDGRLEFAAPEVAPGTSRIPLAEAILHIMDVPPALCTCLRKGS